MSQVEESGVVTFRPRARLLKILGSELISDDVLAITELVKNAHDADASSVTIEFLCVSGPEGQIIVRDDGHGMDLDILLRQWMEPAGTSKATVATRTTPKGRRVLGEKGVGRFAADKLARHLELISRRAGQDSEVRATFDWDEFESETRMLSDITTRWELRPASSLPVQGTILKMSRLRSDWNERMFKRLSSRLSRLRPPFREFDGFSIRIESNDFPEYSKEIQAGFLDRAPYTIRATFDGDGVLETVVNGTRATENLRSKLGHLRCGPIKVTISAFDLETDAIARVGPRIDVQRWLRVWSGISMYRDGFRVWPYGDTDDDWLRLDQRRVNTPVQHLSNNQVVGFVEITRDGNPELLDQTNREGLLHTPALDDLRKLMMEVLTILEARRHAIRHPGAHKATRGHLTTAEGDPITANLERLSARLSGDEATHVRRLSGEIASTLEKERDRHRRLVDAYADLAALGQAGAGLSHTTLPLLEKMRLTHQELRGTLNGRDAPRVRQLLRDLESTMDLLSSRLAMLRPVETDTSRRRRTMDVWAEMESFRRMMTPLLDARQVRMELLPARDAVLRIEMRPEIFHRLLYILTTNSLDWLEHADDPLIEMAAATKDQFCEILFIDCGPGISPDLASLVFEPFYSGRDGGRGLGLTIARNIVDMHGGTIEVVTDGRYRRGARLRILLPRKRSRATLQGG